MKHFPFSTVLSELAAQPAVPISTEAAVAVVSLSSVVLLQTYCSFTVALTVKRTTTMAQEAFPLHALVWNNQYLELDRELQKKEVSREVCLAAAGLLCRTALR